jgi:hypothetical protein
VCETALQGSVRIELLRFEGASAVRGERSEGASGLASTARECQRRVCPALRGSVRGRVLQFWGPSV